MSDLRNLFRLCLLVFVTLLTGMVHAASDEASQQAGEAPVKVNAAVELPKMQKVLDKIKQQVSGETNDGRLSALNDMAIELSGDADTLIQGITPQRTQLQAQLGVLGPAPKADSGVKETAEVTSKRKNLENQKAKIDDQVQQAESIKSGAINLSAQIVSLRREGLKPSLRSMQAVFLVRVSGHRCSTPRVMTVPESAISSASWATPPCSPGSRAGVWVR